MKDFDDTHYTANESFNWTNEEGYEGFLETHEPSWSKVIAQDTMCPGTVWTVCDSEDRETTIITNGVHFVNRIHYFVTNEPATEENESYIWC